MLNVTLLATGALTFAIDGVHWLDGGATAMRHQSAWYTSDCSTVEVESGIKCSALNPAPQTTTTKESDVFGEFTATTLAWSSKTGAKLETAVRT